MFVLLISMLETLNVAHVAMLTGLQTYFVVFEFYYLNVYIFLLPKKSQENN